MIRVLVVDDHPATRRLVSRCLNSTAGMAVVGECLDGSEVPTMAAALHPDVVVMDVHMPEISGFLATRLLRQRRPTPRVLMFSDARTRQDLAEAVDAGAVGYLLKDGDLGTLVAAIRTVAAGGTAWPGGDFGVHAGLVSMSRTGTEGRLPP